VLLRNLLDVSANLFIRAMEERAPHGTFTNRLPRVGDMQFGEV
jgi:hypothetical protein